MISTELFDLAGKTLNGIIAVMPNIIGALLLALVGYLISKWASLLFRKFLRKTKIDALADRINRIDLVERIKFRFLPSKVLSKILYYVLFLIFLIAAADVLKMPAVSALISDMINFLPRLLSACLLLLIGLFVSDAIRGIVLTTCQSLNIPAAKFIAGFIFYFIFVNILMAALHQAGIRIESLAQNISILLGGVVLAFGLGYGLASRDIFANILASYYFNSKLDIGQKIKVDDFTGVIEDITRNHIILRVDDEKTVHIPMHKLGKQDIIFYN